MKYFISILLLFLICCSTNSNTEEPEVINVTSISTSNEKEGNDLIHLVVMSGKSDKPEKYSFKITNETTTSSDYAIPDFSNSVSYDSEKEEITIPAGIENFSITINALTDNDIEEDDETYKITIKDVSAEGTIINIPCTLDYKVGENCYQSYFAGINANNDERALYIETADIFKSLVLDNNIEQKNRNPLWSIKNSGEWVIYYHIEEWEGPVYAIAIENLTKEYERIANQWLETLVDFDAEAPKTVKIKVFGFVFNEGVSVDDSFYDTYGEYPIVTNWKDTGEKSPWRVEKPDGSISDQNWYNIKDFTTLKVTGNETGLDSSIKFSPEDWSNYTHPEGVTMFFTKFWHKATWDAVATRQYLKVGGAISDYAIGEIGYTVFAHEMGHTFFHDDIYAPGKYPNANNSLNSIMNKAQTIQDFDKIIQRMCWETQKE
ncbi:hypothetical protein [Thalassobellus citreus]|uniref:hypothetical protein n=1 Tax=Thalassobellus citreus TaxID=3367752 RepID=UPI0037ACAAF1